MIVSFSRIATFFYDLLAGLFISTPYKGALNSLYAATSPDIQKNNIREKYLDPVGTIGEAHKLAKDEQREEALWNLSETLLQDRGYTLPPI